MNANNSCVCVCVCVCVYTYMCVRVRARARVCLRAQSDERGESMTDTGPLVRLKEAMKKIKKEIKEMDLRIGTVSHNLLHIKMAQSNGESERACVCTIWDSGVRCGE